MYFKLFFSPIMDYFFCSMGTFLSNCSTSFLESSSSTNGSTFPSGDLLVNKIGTFVSLGFPSFSKNLICNFQAIINLLNTI